MSDECQVHPDTEDVDGLCPDCLDDHLREQVAAAEADGFERGVREAAELCSQREIRHEADALKSERSGEAKRRTTQWFSDSSFEARYCARAILSLLPAPPEAEQP